MYDEQVLNVICDMKYCSDVYGKEILDDYPDIDLGEKPNGPFMRNFIKVSILYPGNIMMEYQKLKCFFQANT